MIQKTIKKIFFNKINNKFKIKINQIEKIIKNYRRKINL